MKQQGSLTLVYWCIGAMFVGAAFGVEALLD
jgi:hypothetical protein